MLEEISVNKAIWRGHLMINLPVMLLLIGLPALAYYLSYTQLLFPNWIFGVSFLVGFILAWFIWSIQVTKWRIWAFAKVRNIQELKERAVQEKLIWDDGHFFERTEISSTYQKEQFKNLSKKIEMEDVFYEDITLPSMTKIYISKKLIQFEISILIVVLGVSVYLLSLADFSIGFSVKSNNKSLFLGGLMLIMGLYYLVKIVKKSRITAPQIIISNDGIETVNTAFKTWQEIEFEEVTVSGYGSDKEVFLSYDYGNGYEQINIEPLDVTEKKLIVYLKTYRIRANKKFRF